jgi:hypothetical protein
MQNYHTPITGPYDFRHVRDGTEDLLVITAPGESDSPTDNDHTDVAYLGFWNDYEPETNGRREATARLLASAPELRDMLASLCHAYERLAMYGEPVDLGHHVVDAKLLLARVNATSDQCDFVLRTHFRSTTPDAVESLDAEDSLVSLFEGNQP